MLVPNTIYINASIGISIFPDDGQTTQELIKNADMAMYKAKSEGKNKFVMFTQEMNDKLLNRIRIENAIRTGLKLREFSVFYQPKIDVESEQPTSFEALIRWRKNGTIIGPDQFISIAEDCGLIDEMSLYVLDEVCIFLGKVQGQQPAGVADQRQHVPQNLQQSQNCRNHRRHSQITSYRSSSDRV